MRFASIWFFLAVSLYAAKPPDLDRARELYLGTDYRASLSLLLPQSQKDPQVLLLMGQDYFMLGEYKKATEILEKSVSAGNSGYEVYLWLGRAYGRRAETAGPFSAAGLATHARKSFEKAVELDIANHEAAGDLLDYYLGAPAFMGGGINKAEDLAKRVAATDPAEGEYLFAQIEDKRKRFDTAEVHLRRAAELEPRKVSRILPLAVHLAKHGRAKESDALFAEAAKREPRNPNVVFSQAETYVETHRNLEDARKLLHEYLTLPLTPDDPPRHSAEALLAKIEP